MTRTSPIAALLALALLAAPALASDWETRLTTDETNVYLSLPDAVRLALERNPELRTQAVGARISDSAVRGARGIFDFYLDASLQKNHSKSVSRSRFESATSIFERENNTYTLGVSKLFGFGTTANLSLYGDRSATTSGISTFNPAYGTNATFTLTQPLLKDFGRRAMTKNVVVARNNAAMSAYDLEARVSETLTRVVTTYWDAVYARENIKVTREALARAKDLYAATEARVRVGILPPVDMAQAEAGVAAREEAIVVAESAFEAACDQLRLLLGFPSDAALWEKGLVLGDRPPVAEEAPSASEAARAAFENRPEWKRVQREGANSRLELDFARNQKLPKLNLMASYGASGFTGYTCIDANFNNICDPGEAIIDEGFSDAWSQTTGRDNPSWSVGLSFAYAIRNRVASSAYERARLMEEQFEISRESLETRILAEVRGAVRDVDTNLKRVEAARANRILQQKRLDIETERYKNGLSTVFQVLDAQAELTAAEAAETKAALDYHRSTVALEKATGTLASKRGVEFAHSEAATLEP